MCSTVPAVTRIDNPVVLGSNGIMTDESSILDPGMLNGPDKSDIGQLNISHITASQLIDHGCDVFRTLPGLETV